MISNKRSLEICSRLDEISKELREIASELGKSVHIMTSVNKEGKSATQYYVAGYRKDHFYDGFERLSYGQYTVDPEQVVFGGYPAGLETTIQMKELQRERQKRKKN